MRRPWRVLIVFTLLSGLLALLREPAGSHRLARRLMWRVGLSALLLLLLSLLLLAVEALNTAIEVLCDHVTPEIHPMIKKAKDLGSAAIFIVGSAMALVLVLTVADLIRK